MDEDEEADEADEADEELDVEQVYRKGVEVLCHNCQWTAANQVRNGGYDSRIKIAHAVENSALWTLGNDWFVRDEANAPCERKRHDYLTQKFLRDNAVQVPLVEMHRFGEEEDRFHFTVMRKANGERLDKAAKRLTRKQKIEIVDDLKRCITNWRRFTSDTITRVDGSELPDMYIGQDSVMGCLTMGRSTEEWFEKLRVGVRKGLLNREFFTHELWRLDKPQRKPFVKQVDKEVAELMAKCPRGGPYVLTHGDLHDMNVFVAEGTDGKWYVSAIIDWEHSGYAPWWVEGLGIQIGTEDDELWELADECQYIGYSKKAFYAASSAVGKVEDAWVRGAPPCDNKHEPGAANAWYTKPFCRCKPYVGKIEERDLGQRIRHLDAFDPDLTHPDCWPDGEPNRRDDCDDVGKEGSRFWKDVFNGEYDDDSESKLPIRIYGS